MNDFVIVRGGGEKAIFKGTHDTKPHAAEIAQRDRNLRHLGMIPVHLQNQLLQRLGCAVIHGDPETSDDAAAVEIAQDLFFARQKRL